MNGYSYFRTQDSILGKIIPIIKDMLVGVEITDISYETRLFEDLMFDSLDLVEFIMKCEQEFGISIEDEYFENLYGDFNIEYVCKIIREKLSK